MKALNNYVNDILLFLKHPQQMLLSPLYPINW
jgi:hypothetical protein